jgi:peptidoglycan hydrolase-like protein with peptidoglycan-binding domain
LQAALRDSGFYRGPVDGVAGARTKAAYVRLHTGCLKASPVLEDQDMLTGDGQAPVGMAGRSQSANREQIKNIQAQLRQAGFDPGPVDGVFGSKTHAAVRQFQKGCVIAREFSSLLHDGSPAPSGELVGTSSAAAAIAAPNSLSDSDDKQPAAVRSREEVRILQLRLRDAGFDPGPFDGVMGPKTRAALAQYEASQRGKKIKTSLTNTSVTGQY